MNDNVKTRYLNVNEFISHNCLDMILNNDLINKSYFELYNFSEMYDDEWENFMESPDEYLTDETLLAIKESYGVDLSTTVPSSELLNVIIDEYEDEIDESINYNALYFEVYQYFIISERDADEYWTKYTSYPVSYSDELDIYLLGITHWGMSWEFFDTKFEVYC